jgi:hypothetical protein
MTNDFSSPEIDLYLQHLKKQEQTPPERILKNYWGILLSKIQGEEVRIRKARIIRRVSYELATGFAVVILFFWMVNWLNLKYPVWTYIKLAGQLW